MSVIFKLNKIWGSYSTTVRARVGPNEGNKITNGQKLIKIVGGLHKGVGCVDAGAQIRGGMHKLCG